MKNLFKPLMAIVASVIILSACSSPAKDYEVIEKGSGAVAEPGNFMMLMLSLKTEDGEVLFDSEEFGQPFFEPKQDPATEITSVVEKMLQNFSREGEVLRKKMTATEAYEGNVPDNLTADQILIMEGKLVRVFADAEAVENYQMQKQQEDASAQTTIDLKLIDEYLQNNGINAQIADNGVRYVVTQAGNGKKPQPGDQIRVHYKGYLLDGSVFDTSIASEAEKAGKFNPGRAYEPLEFTVGMGMVIRGWDEGLLLFEEGSKGTIFIPSGLAYGPRGAGADILPNSVLIFDVELVEIK